MEDTVITANLCTCAMANGIYTQLEEDFNLSSTEITKLLIKWAKKYMEEDVRLSYLDFLRKEVANLPYARKSDSENYKHVMGAILAHYGAMWEWDGDDLKIIGVDMEEYKEDIFRDIAWVKRLYDFWKEHHPTGPLA